MFLQAKIVWKIKIFGLKLASSAAVFLNVTQYSRPPPEASLETGWKGNGGKIDK